MKFEDLSLQQVLLDGLDAMGFSETTPIQEQAIPQILDGKDIIACAQTGTGKTAAYVLPVLNMIYAEGTKGKVNALILAPTRELAVQIDQQIEALAYFLNMGSVAIYGGGDGVNWGKQGRALMSGAEIIVATPGRLMALLRGGKFDFSHLRYFILDEADRMLDMGFHGDIMQILESVPKNRQSLLFSATMPHKIKKLAQEILKDPVEVTIGISKPAEGIDQRAYIVYDEQKDSLLRILMKEQDYISVIIFCSTKKKAKELGFQMKRWGFNAYSFHSELEQKERDELMLNFKNKKIQILVGTDILSRGIDIDSIDLVVNYDAPPDPEDYVHRIGRTARAERKGTAVTLINPKDQSRLRRIEQLIEKEVPKCEVPESLGKTPEYNGKAERRDNNPRRKGKRKPGGR